MIVGCTIMRLACLFTPKTTEWNWVGPLFCTYAHFVHARFNCYQNFLIKIRALNSIHKPTTLTCQYSVGPRIRTFLE